MKKIIVLLMCACFIMFGCSEENNKEHEDIEQAGTKEPETPGNPQTNIYVVGQVSSSDDGGAFQGGIPALWKNGELTLLSLGTDSRNGLANDVCTLGNDVYAVGYVMVDWENSDETRPVIWKNGIAEVLENEWGECNSICILKDDIYVAGSINNQPVLWKNGAKTVLASQGHARVVRTDGMKIYVGGTNGGSAVVWIDGVSQTLDLPNVQAPEVLGLFINNGTIYASGQVYKAGTGFIPVYWKNKSLFELSGNNYTQASDICFFKGDVIAVGGTWSGKYVWKNGYVENTTASFQSIKIFDNQCYIVGFEDGKVVVSIDGEKIYYDTMVNKGYNNAYGYGIFILKD